MPKIEKVNIIATFSRIREIKSQIKTLEDEQEMLQDLLKRTIPSGTIQDGVMHVLSQRESTSYADFCTFLIDKFVPGTKKATASSMKAQFTKITEIHSLKVEK